MDWLLHNPLAEMSGPAFLALYATVIVLVVFHMRWSIHRNDPTRNLEPPPSPPSLTPLGSPTFVAVPTS